MNGLEIFTFIGIVITVFVTLSHLIIELFKYKTQKDIERRKLKIERDKFLIEKEKTKLETKKAQYDYIRTLYSMIFETFPTIKNLFSEVNIDDPESLKKVMNKIKKFTEKSTEKNNL